MFLRIFDIGFSLLCLLILTPLYILIALLIRIESKGPILFKQTRVGKGERTYYIYKFRSMYVHHYAPEELGPIKHDGLFVTRVGYILRRFKLDEIPQFFNVLKGDMSLIGPRPCLCSRIATMSSQEKRRFCVLPGITSWAEVNGNIELDWHEQLALDLWYIDHKTFWLDMVILAKTILIILFGSIKNKNAIQQAQIYLRSNGIVNHSALNGGACKAKAKQARG